MSNRTTDLTSFVALQWPPDKRVRSKLGLDRASDKNKVLNKMTGRTDELSLRGTAGTVKDRPLA